MKFDWDGWFAIFFIIFIFGFLFWIGNPNSEHNVEYRKFAEDCSSKGGTVVYTKVNAKNAKWFCAKEAT